MPNTVMQNSPESPFNAFVRRFWLITVHCSLPLNGAWQNRRARTHPFWLGATVDELSWHCPLVLVTVVEPTVVDTASITSIWPSGQHSSIMNETPTILGELLEGIQPLADGPTSVKFQHKVVVLGANSPTVTVGTSSICTTSLAPHSGPFAQFSRV